MIDQVLTELDALSRRGEYTDEDDLVFVSPEGSHLEDSALRWRFYAALEAAVIKPLRFHALRATPLARWPHRSARCLTSRPTWGTPTSPPR